MNIWYSKDGLQRCPKCKSTNTNNIAISSSEINVQKELWYCNDCKFKQEKLTLLQEYITLDEGGRKKCGFCRGTGKMGTPFSAPNDIATCPECFGRGESLVSAVLGHIMDTPATNAVMNPIITPERAPMGHQWGPQKGKTATLEQRKRGKKDRCHTKYGRKLKYNKKRKKWEKEIDRKKIVSMWCD